MTPRKQLGQSVVEFAVLLPIMLLLIMGALDLGRAFFMKIALTNAAREGAYYISYHPTDKAAAYTGTHQAVIAEAYGAGLNLQPADVAIVDCCTVGQPVEVTATSTIRLSILRFMFGDLTLTGKARMMVQQ